MAAGTQYGCNSWLMHPEQYDFYCWHRRLVRSNRRQPDPPDTSRSWPPDPTISRCTYRPTSCSWSSEYDPIASSPQRPARARPQGRISVDRQMRTNLPDVFAAGDCAMTYHRLLGPSYLPLGTTAHKQDASPLKTRSAAPATSPAASAPRSSRCSTSSPPAPAYATTKPRPVRPSHRHRQRRRPQGLLPRQPPDHDALHGDRQTGRLLGLQLPAISTPRSPNASTSPHGHLQRA